jgi:hypothetical protein
MTTRRSDDIAIANDINTGSDALSGLDRPIRLVEKMLPTTPSKARNSLRQEAEIM